MEISSEYTSPLGNMVIAADDKGLTGLWFTGQKYLPTALPDKGNSEIIEAAEKWLDIYFSGRIPDFNTNIPLSFKGTDFQREVWELLCRIPYGETVTYGQLAAEIAQNRGIPRMSAQAVGGAVSRNRISIIVPCHRVIGENGSLTGYAGGIRRKEQLLELEGIQAQGHK